VHTNRVLTNELDEDGGDCDSHPVVLLLMLLADNWTAAILKIEKRSYLRHGLTDLHENVAL